MFAYVGGYTTPDRKGRGDGIHVYRIGDDGGWNHVQHVAGERNPSLFTLRRDNRVLFSVHGALDYVSAFAIDAQTGHLSLINRQHCQGENPVDSTLDPSERFLVVANYSSGGVAVLPVATDGALGPVAQLVALSGTHGPDPVHQTGPHPHGVIFDPSGRFVIVPDKGLDCVFVFRFEAGRLVPAAQERIAARAGAAPRHCVFHPRLPLLYVNNELDSTVTAYRFDDSDGWLEALQTETTIPGGFGGRNSTAEIAVTPDGRHLYVSNRGQDSVAVFSIAPDSGALRYIASEPTQGSTPRFFTLDHAGEQLFAANQEGDNIVCFRVDCESGRLSPTGKVVRVGSPSAISLVSGRREA
jgi:6-phosphogluconolactonase (cycloisomerase 2 family)